MPVLKPRFSKKIHHLKQQRQSNVTPEEFLVAREKKSSSFRRQPESPSSHLSCLLS